jgi:hypothetical protein
MWKPSFLKIVDILTWHNLLSRKLLIFKCETIIFRHHGSFKYYAANFLEIDKCDIPTELLLDVGRKKLQNSVIRVAWNGATCSFGLPAAMEVSKTSGTTYTAVWLGTSAVILNIGSYSYNWADY